jgi:hypothetical protein
MPNGDKLYEVLAHIDSHLADIARSLATLTHVAQHQFPEGVKKAPPAHPAGQRRD